jgi:two-component system nitrogen regulation response regulator GlnG
LTRVSQVAPTHSSVLLLGPTGTGKELFARAVHERSRRHERPLVRVNCAALPPTLVESELFGHVRGSFTGADGARQGLLELADGATVFFDEANDIPPAVQVKLLRVLEQHEVTPVGSAESRRTSFRVIAATNRDLSAAGHDSPLRRDLYFRLAAFEIALPPLRQRVEDVPLLAERFLARLQAAGQWAGGGFTRAAIAELCQRTWPGNVRQLLHAVEHGALLARAGHIGVEHLPPEVEVAAPPAPAADLDGAVRSWTSLQLTNPASDGRLYQSFLSQVEPALFDVVLHHTSGNRAAAADRLGIHRATLRKKLLGGGEEG